MNITKFLRLVAGLIVSVTIILATDLFPIPWKFDVARLSFVQLYLILGVSALLVVGIATFAGAMVARINFIVPALILAVAVWFMAISFIGSESPASGGPESVSTSIANLIGFALTIGGAIGGAVLGRRLYMRKQNNDSIPA